MQRLPYLQLRRMWGASMFCPCVEGLMVCKHQCWKGKCLHSTFEIDFWMIDAIILSLVIHSSRFHNVMFMHKKISLVRFDFRKPIVGLGLDIEDNDISFNLINKDTQLMNDGYLGKVQGKKMHCDCKCLLKHWQNSELRFLMSLHPHMSNYSFVFIECLK